MLRLHDTALGRVVDVEPAVPGRFSLYVCGPTVYDVPHVGHGRTAVVYDILRRYLQWKGVAVEHVSNVTDIDDKIIDRARLIGADPAEVARRSEEQWWEALDALGVLRPTGVPHATDYVADMIELISRLIDAGHAYAAEDGVYFAVDTVPDYGLLARQSLESLRAGARVETSDMKRSPLDFALWKRAKPGEPEWDSPWGPGRPGWHTECVVMSLDLLGDGFDLHTGGLDLQFPHHENERAQAEALGYRFARHWMHHAFIEVAGEKMSKSLGNFTSLPDFLERSDPRTLRLLILQSHYRAPMELTTETVAAATAALARLDGLARRFPEPFRAAGPDGPLPDADAEAVNAFRRAMDDDLSTPSAVGVMFDAISRANVAESAGDGQGACRWAATVASLGAAVGLAARHGEDEVDPAVAEAVARLDAARAERDFATADAIRRRLTEQGWVVENTPEGTRVHR